MSEQQKVMERKPYKLRYPIIQSGVEVEAGNEVRLNASQLDRVKAHEKLMDDAKAKAEADNKGGH